MTAACPNCGASGLSLCYSVRGISVHSCLLMDSRDEATGYRRGDLDLLFCSACGFLTNGLFDPAVHEYSARYEETQGFSPTFNRFAEGLARTLVERHGLKGKTVLEIGCGKGEFLVSLCRAGQCRGIGIDPSYIPSRTAPEDAARVKFIRDFYGRKYSHLSADFICCRHTLEHIAPTLEFTRELRRTISDRRDIIVFIEVPDVLRVLREGAFWDTYYEHCSYFSPGSLARVFRACGFDVTDLELAYDDQYILLTARPTDGPTRPRLALEDDLPALVDAVERFRQTGPAAVAKWRELIIDATDAGGRVVVWGSGSKGVAFLTTLGVDARVEYVVDINPHRQGKFMPGTGQRIMSPQFLAEYRPTHVIAMNPVYRDEIRADLDRMGVKAELLAV